MMMKENEENQDPAATAANDLVQMPNPLAKAIRKRKVKTEEEKQLERQVEEEERDARKTTALQSMKYLLSISEKYSSFVEKIFMNVNAPLRKEQLKENRFQPTVRDINKQDLLAINKTKAPAYKKPTKTDVDITKHMKYFEGSKLHEFQVEGVTWMNTLYSQSVNCILADEMGLGKTIQTIAFVCHLLEHKTNGPFLIIVPMSTLPHWHGEFERFAPKIPVVVFHGNKQVREDLHRRIHKSYRLDDKLVWPIVLTTYETPLLEEHFLKRIKWHYIVVDEAHRIKNPKAKLSLQLRKLQSLNRLLLTGTPIQNNIKELWALLNFIMPHIFKSVETFEYLYLLDEMDNTDLIVKQEENTKFLSTLHKVLEPFMLRRLKSEVLPDLVAKKEVMVYCALSDIQRTMYTHILDRSIAQLLFNTDEDNIATSINLDEPRPKRKCTLKPINYCQIEREMNVYQSAIVSRQKRSDINFAIDDSDSMIRYLNRLTMQSPLSMYRKVVDHPYLIHFPLNPNSAKPELLIDDNLIKMSSKMMVLDAMLTELKKRGHKVLLFSTLCMLLDLVEEYMLMKKYNYRRLDGACDIENRTVSVNEFNENPDVFIFLMSTRAGGLGLNLTAADTVIFFDRDWNPQIDIQAQARCHRIGQTRPVVVYTLVAKNTIDEIMLSKGNSKRKLEKLVISNNKFSQMSASDRTKVRNELIELRELLNSEASSQKVHPNGCVFTAKELNELLDRSDMMPQK